MLRPHENQFLTHIGPETAMGQFFRRFWLPALLSEELPLPDCPPVRVRLLGEDLVAFRDTKGRIGLLDSACAHRHVDLFWGRNEDCGLRCVYHGWKYDVEGNCVDMPNVPQEFDVKHKVRLKAYPTQEQGGVIWTYMGPRELTPELPEMDWMLVPESHRYITKVFAECNYLQMMEGDLDGSHAAFLHGPFDLQGGSPGVPASTQPGTRRLYKDRAPRTVVKDTEYGLMVGSRREATDDAHVWRVSHWLLPFYTMFASSADKPQGFNLWVPVDDEHTCIFPGRWKPHEPLTAEQVYEYRFGGNQILELIPGGYLPKRNKSNDYLIDRGLQKSYSFTGVKGTSQQDMMVNESQGHIADRSTEYLVSSDVAIIAMRRKLLKVAKALQQGTEPYAARNGTIYRVRPLEVLLRRDVPFPDEDEKTQAWLTARAQIEV